MTEAIRKLAPWLLRNISQQGWMNDAEHESPVLLYETLELRGDRCAIYGFSGINRKHCEIFRVNSFDKPNGETAHSTLLPGARAHGRRHRSPLRRFQVDARIKLLITLSDGKPGDYHDGYHGQYGIEDTHGSDRNQA